MSNVLNIKTMEYLRSVHTPDYTNADYLINPVIPDCEQKYWKLNASKTKLLKMTTLEKTAIDNAEIKTVEDNEKKIQAEQIIQENIRELAIQKGVDDGKLNIDGSLK